MYVRCVMIAVVYLRGGNATLDLDRAVVINPDWGRGWLGLRSSRFRWRLLPFWHWVARRLVFPRWSFLRLPLCAKRGEILKGFRFASCWAASSSASSTIRNWF